MPSFRFICARVLVPLLLTLYAAGCTAKQKRAGIQKRAESYFAASEYDKAKIEYLNLLRADPLNTNAILRLGFIWSEQGAPIQAYPFLLKARELAPQNLENRTKLAFAFVSLGALPESRKEAIAIVEQSPTQDEAILLLAETAITKEDLDDTAERLKKLAEPARASVKLASAILSARTGDAAAAEAGVRQALELDAKSVDARLAIATLFWSKKDLARAGQEFKTAAELAPWRATARLKYADFKVKTRALDEGRAILKEVTQHAPDYLPAWGLQAQLSLLEKKYDEALALLENVFGRDPGNIEARMLQAQAWLAKGEIKKCVEGLERLNKMYPNLPSAMYALAQAYLQDRNESQAGVILKRLVAASPGFGAAVLALGEVNLRTGDAQSVVAPMVDFLKTHPKTVQAELLLAEAYRMLGRFDEASAIYQEQSKVAPENPTPHLLRGLILRQQGKTAEARKAFEKSLQLAPQNLQTTYQLVELDVADKAFDTALGRVQAELKRSPDSATVHFLAARIYAAQDLWDQTEVALRKTLELDANFSTAYDLLISTYLRTNKLPQALAELQGLLSKNPKNASAMMESALIYEKMKDYPKAREMYERLLAITPDFAPALNNLAGLCSGPLNDLDKGLEVASKARSLQATDPKVSASIADTLGWILFKKKDYAKALPLIQESAGAMPDNAEIQFHLGMTQYMMGQTQAARTALRLAADAPTDFEGKEEARRRLALMEKGPGKPVELSSDELEILVKQQPDDIVAQMNLAGAYERQGAFDKAAAAYEQVLKVNPKFAAAMLRLTQIYVGPLKNPERAVKLAKKARELLPNDPEAAGILGGVAYRSGDFAWAYSLLQQSTAEKKPSAAALHDFAWAAYSSGRLEESRLAMQRLLQAAPASVESEDANVFLALTTAKTSEKDLSGLQVEALKALKVNPDYIPAVMVNAGLDAYKGNSAAATAMYLDILKRCPDFAPAQKQLAAVYLKDPATRDKAYSLAIKARKTLSEDGELARILGELSYHRKEYSYAAQLFQESARKSPLNAQDLYYLGMAQVQAREKIRGLESLRQALAAGLTEPFESEAKRVLADTSQE